MSKVALPTKFMSLRLRNHSSTGRLSLFWPLPTEKEPPGRLINKSSGFFTKILDMSIFFGRPIRGLFKARFHEATNHNDERDKTADDHNKSIGITDLIGRTTNILYLTIVLWSTTRDWKNNWNWHIWSVRNTCLADQTVLCSADQQY